MPSSLSPCGVAAVRLRPVLPCPRLPCPRLPEGSSDESGALQRCVRAFFSSPRVELFGVLLGMVTAWYLRRRGRRAQAEDGGRVALSKRVARGVPILLATG